MRAEILSIGTELLVGSILNSNSRFLSQRLVEHAIDVYHQVTVGDNPERLIEAIRAAARRADIVITSGGLGPTQDDVTAQGLAQFLGKPLVLHRPTYAHIARRLKQRGLAMTKLVARQCYIPQGVTVMTNSKGTASGLFCETTQGGRKIWLIVLPGPPRELEPMFVGQALPLLLRRLPIHKDFFLVRAVRIAGLLEIQVASKVNDLLIKKPPLTVGIYAKPGEVELKIMSKASSAAKAKKAADRLEALIRSRFKEKVYGIDRESLASAVGKLLIKNRVTLGVAESCTGGLLGQRITEVAGSSNYFWGGVISYSDHVKRSMLGVDGGLIRKHGAVSAPVAKAMAQGVRRKLGSDIGVAITGIAGPSGGSNRKPVGLVYIAVAGQNKTFVQSFFFLGDRGDIRSSAANKALDVLRLFLMKALG